MKRIKKGDKVRVISGNHKGSEGVIKEIDYNTLKAVVEGVYQLTKHKKVTKDNQESGIIKIDGGLHFSKLAIIDDKANGAVSKITYKINKQGKKARFTRKSGSEIASK
ncbi:MAG: 50S ribosomal protein L24 [Mycoplasmoidaceae bacterium]